MKIACTLVPCIYSFLFPFSASTYKLTKGKTEARQYNHTDTAANERSKQFNENILPATTYEFKLKLVAPIIEMEVPDHPVVTVEMESKAAIKNCYTNPSPLSGEYQIPFNNFSATSASNGGLIE